MVLLALALFTLNGCRYLELYRFSEQFCHFEEYISITPESTGTVINFHEPVLKQALLLRYLGAAPFQGTKTNDNDTPPSDIFLIATPLNNKRFMLTTNYHTLDEHKLLKSGKLDSQLSAVFSPKLIENILLSLCTEDYDLSTTRLEFRFKLNSLLEINLPSRQLILDTFGSRDNDGSSGGDNSSSLNYQLAFVNKLDEYQTHKINLKFDFDSKLMLKRIGIQYFKYDYEIDLAQKKGRLVVTRN